MGINKIEAKLLIFEHLYLHLFLFCFVSPIGFNLNALYETIIIHRNVKYSIKMFSIPFNGKLLDFLYPDKIVFYLSKFMNDHKIVHMSFIPDQ